MLMGEREEKGGKADALHLVLSGMLTVRTSAPPLLAAPACLLLSAVACAFRFIELMIWLAASRSCPEFQSDYGEAAPLSSARCDSGTE